MTKASRLGVVAFLLLFGVGAAEAQQPFPARGVEIVQGLYAGVNPQNDDARRERITITCEQMRFELGARWGGKRRAPNGPVSPDSLAYLEPDDSLSVWDIQVSSGAITVFENKPPDYPNLPQSEARFVECAAVDHLGAVVIPPPAPEPPPPVVIDNGPILSRLDVLLAEVIAARQSLEEHRAEVRKERNRVVAFLSNWRNYAKIGAAIVGTIATQRMTDAPAK